MPSTHRCRLIGTFILCWSLCAVATLGIGCTEVVAPDAGSPPDGGGPITAKVADRVGSGQANSGEPADSSLGTTSEQVADVEPPNTSDSSEPPETNEPDENELPTANQAADAKPKLPENPFPIRIPAEELDGGVDWINTAGPLELKQLRGKFVMLDFWTYCCINCMHVLPELKKLEHAWPNNLVVIGVHWNKFTKEADSRNIAEAVLRYEIEHPVVNDARHEIRRRYGINSWPSILLIDPEGQVVAFRAGESTFEYWNERIAKGIEYYRAKGVLDETPLRFDLEAYNVAATPLRYPGKVLADEASDRLFIADSNHNRLVVTRLDGTLLEVIGSGAISSVDGDYATCGFNKPQGMALMGETLYVADTENHLLRKVDLETRQVTTIAGQGVQGRIPWPGLRQRLEANLPAPQRWVGKPLETELNSPWALCIHNDDLYIAMAGPHQIWKMPLDESEIGPYAGNGLEDIVDGPLLPRNPYDEGYASFAQPSGLASDGKWLYVADSEGSSIRAVPFDPQAMVRTVVGTAHLDLGRLFVFGDVDGDATSTRLQHPLGVAYREGKLYVADTYNDKIKVIDLESQTCTTLMLEGSAEGEEFTPLDEPAGLSIAGDRLYVADTNNHLIRMIELNQGNRLTTLEIAGLEPPAPASPTETAVDDFADVIELQPAHVRPVDGKLLAEVKITLPEGYKINAQAPMNWGLAHASPDGLVAEDIVGLPYRVASPGRQLVIEIPLATIEGQGAVAIELSYYYCQEGAEAICRQAAVRWKLPIDLAEDAPSSKVELQHAVEP